ncbi:MAG: YdcF family protein [Deltaproteobacteria bacterium]|nr:YdcF family protein [Deltaproteobacteria bacterium]
MRRPKLLKFKAPRGDSTDPVGLPVLWWAVGFISALLVLLGVTLWMAQAVYQELPPSAQLGDAYKPADVVVVLTGGRGRIRKALELYEKGYGKMLYISGTDRQVQMKEILKELRWVGPVDDSHIILENISTNTLQNAYQVNRFVTEQGLKRILLVTSIYHVRRAHYIFRKVLPRDVQIDVSWFEQAPFEAPVWWTHWNGIWVTMSEFFKFFYAYLRLLS